MARWAPTLWAFARQVVMVGPVAVTFNDMVYSVCQVSGRSMQPTLNPDAGEVGHVDDRVLEDRWSTRLYRYNRGDVVVLRAPDDAKSSIVKRLIAVEGDWINYEGGVERIPKGHCWVEGDNAKLSTDSRSAYGPVPLALIEGRVRYVVWPPSRWGVVESAVPPGRVILQRMVSVENV